MDALALQAAEEVFCNGVVVGIAFAGHTLAETKVGETQTVCGGSVLDAAVGVEDQAVAGLAAADSHVEGIKREARVDTVGEGIADG